MPLFYIIFLPNITMKLRSNKCTLFFSQVDKNTVPCKLALRTFLVLLLQLQKIRMNISVFVFLESKVRN